MDGGGLYLSSHQEGRGRLDRDGRTVMDLVSRPEFSPSSAAAEFAGIVKSYGFHEITKEAWGVGWVDAAFREHGITCKASDKTGRICIWNYFKAINSEWVELLDNERLRNHLCSLERRVARSGKDPVNHPEGAHDDVIKAAAWCLLPPRPAR